MTFTKNALAIGCNRHEGKNPQPVERQEFMSNTTEASPLFPCYRFDADFCIGHSIEEILGGHYFHVGELHREQVASASSDVSSAFSTATDQTGVKLIVSVD